MSCRDISTLVNTILQVYMSTQGALKSIHNGKESILTLFVRGTILQQKFSSLNFVLILNSS